MKTHQHLWSMTAIIATLLVCNMAVQLVNAQQEAPVPKVLVAQEFRLVNARNQMVATMSTDSKGQPQIALFGGRQEFDTHVEKRLQLNLDEFGQPNLYLNDYAGKPRIRMSLFSFKSDETAPQIEIMDARNQVSARLGVNVNVNPELELFENNYNAGSRLVLKSDSLSLRAGKNSAQTSLFASDGKVPGLVFAGQDGKWVWTAPPQKIAFKKK